MLALSLMALAGCSSVKGLKKFAECKFDYNSVSDVRLATVDISKAKNITSIKALDLPKILSAIEKRELTLALNVNVDVKNPNAAEAVLQGFDYIFWIDDKEMLAGTMDKRMTVAPNSRATLSIPFSVELMSLLSKDKINPMAGFVFGLATNNADASRVKVSLKPYFSFMGKTIKFPSYITVGGDKIMPKK